MEVARLTTVLGAQQQRIEELQAKLGERGGALDADHLAAIRAFLDEYQTQKVHERLYADARERLKRSQARVNEGQVLTT